ATTVGATKGHNARQERQPAKLRARTPLGNGQPAYVGRAKYRTSEHLVGRNYYARARFASPPGGNASPRARRRLRFRRLGTTARVSGRGAIRKAALSASAGEAQWRSAVRPGRWFRDRQRDAACHGRRARRSQRHRRENWDRGGGRQN